MCTEAIEVVKSFSRHTEDIVDVEQQRYDDDDFLDVVTASRSDFLSQPDDSRDDEWANELREGGTSDDDDDDDDVLTFSSSSSSLNDDDDDDASTFQEEEEQVKEIHYLDPFDQLISGFHIKAWIERFQAGNLRPLIKAKSNDTRSEISKEKRRRNRSRQRMEAELQREIRLADKLERTLDEREQDFAAKLAAQNQKLETLESKLRLQEQIFESQLEADRATWIGNSDKALMEQVESLKNTICALEATISELNEQNFWNQQEKESELKSEKQKVEHLENKLFNLEEELDEQRTEYMQLQVLRNKEAFLLECEKRKNRALDRSETQAIVSLLEEQKRAQFLAEMNVRRQASVRTRNKNRAKRNKNRAKNLPKLSTEIEEKQLKENDQQVASIRGIFGQSIDAESQATSYDLMPEKST